MVRNKSASVDNLTEEDAEDLSFLSDETLAVMDSESYRQKVAELAYLKAEKRGFEPGFEMDDWLEAEREIRAGLVAGTLEESDIT